VSIRVTVSSLITSTYHTVLISLYRCNNFNISHRVDISLQMQ